MTHRSTANLPEPLAIATGKSYVLVAAIFFEFLFEIHENKFQNFPETMTTHDHTYFLVMAGTWQE